MPQYSQLGTFTRGCPNEQAVAGRSAEGRPSGPHYLCPSVLILVFWVMTGGTLERWSIQDILLLRSSHSVLC